ncbi:MAG: ribbon-helix-helix protein, CopG family [Helicobacteraceae bacterium]|jgi:predicted DNA-binding protein|nr:ribbon-helix-helix protein, CopG family [Helicobacteraceae bacterium]
MPIYIINNGRATMLTVRKSYSLDTSVINTIAALARELNKKQSQIIKEAIEEYAER